jgi:hypothetical protein
MASLRNVLFLAVAASLFVLACRVGDLAQTIRQSRAGVTTAETNAISPEAGATSSLLGLADTPTEAAAETPSEPPTEALVPSLTEAPTEVSVPADTSTPRPTRKPAPPTRVPPPTETYTPAPPPGPTRCPYQYCVIKADCIPGENIRAIGYVYSNGVPVNGVLVRVAQDFNGARVADDFVSGHDPVNKRTLWPKHEGYYQVGVSEGLIKAGTWVVFLIDTGSKQPISEGRSFTTDAQQTGSSCQVAVTDFGS